MRKTARSVRLALGRHASPEAGRRQARFFRTARGEYGEGDRFLGVRVPDQRRVARAYRDLPPGEIVKLLSDPLHECRLTALFILVDRFRCPDAERRREMAELYLANLDRVNNWDLVDASADKILGAWLETRDRELLAELARSGDLWRQRVAMVATFHFIRSGDFDDAFRIAQVLLRHEHDLIHKAVGWMLREIGKRDVARLERFLRPRYRAMPRTMLRYAIERFGEPKRQAYLKGRV